MRLGSAARTVQSMRLRGTVMHSNEVGQHLGKGSNENHVIKGVVAHPWQPGTCWHRTTSSKVMRVSTMATLYCMNGQYTSAVLPWSSSVVPHHSHCNRTSACLQQDVQHPQQTTYFDTEYRECCSPSIGTQCNDTATLMRASRSAKQQTTLYSYSYSQWCRPGSPRSL